MIKGVNKRRKHTQNKRKTTISGQVLIGCKNGVIDWEKRCSDSVRGCSLPCNVQSGGSALQIDCLLMVDVNFCFLTWLCRGLGWSSKFGVDKPLDSEVIAPVLVGVQSGNRHHLNQCPLFLNC